MLSGSVSIRAGQRRYISLAYVQNDPAVIPGLGDEAGYSKPARTAGQVAAGGANPVGAAGAVAARAARQVSRARLPTAQCGRRSSAQSERRASLPPKKSKSGLEGLLLHARAQPQDRLRVHL